MRARSRGALTIAAAVVALGAAVVAQVVRDARFPLDQRATERILYVRSGAVVKRLALEFDGLAADMYWIRAIQHYGGDRLGLTGRSGHDYELLYPLLDLTTTLDPYFSIAYRFGAIFLSEGNPGGPGRPDLAVALLRKGIAAQPAKWQYYLDIGFVYYWNLRNFKMAAEWFQRGALQPNAPNWLEPLAATMLIRGGDRTSSRFLWQQLLHSDQPWLQRTAERRLVQIDALDQIDRLEQIVRRFQPPLGRYTWAWLVARRAIPGVPLDPAGTPYDLDPVTGRITISRQSELYPMPDDIRQTLQ